MVKICDAIMGSGKTSATIAYINAHPEKRFLYITPYLKEATRIKEGCPNANFIEPTPKRYKRTKYYHTMELIQEGKNIASTHQAMDYYTEDTFKLLREMNYTVIIDEAINILQEATDVTVTDVEILSKAGYVVEEDDGMYLKSGGLEYNGTIFTNIFRVLSSRPLVCMNPDRHRRKYLCWIFSDYLFKYVEDIIVLTYLFKDSEMDMFMQMRNVPYRYIGIRRTQDDVYEFADTMEYVPEYVQNLDNMIIIEQSERMNRVGKNRCALSRNWYVTNKGKEKMDELRRNLNNYFRNRVECESKDRMCGNYKGHWDCIRGAGYWKSDVIYNQRSSNEYSNRTVLAYPVNIYANREVVKFYAKYGMVFDDDHYALSTMVQWIWRSAIRNGETVHLYLPSKRMRTLLENWIKETMEGANKHGTEEAA